MTFISRIAVHKRCCFLCGRFNWPHYVRVLPVRSLCLSVCLL